MAGQLLKDVWVCTSAFFFLFFVRQVVSNIECEYICMYLFVNINVIYIDVHISIRENVYENAAK